MTQYVWICFRLLTNVAKLFDGSYDNSQFHMLIKDKITLFQILLHVSVCNGLQYLGPIRNKLPYSARFLCGATSGHRCWLGPLKTLKFPCWSAQRDVYLNIVMPLFTQFCPLSQIVSVCKELRAFYTYLISDRSPDMPCRFGPWSNNCAAPKDWAEGRGETEWRL